MNASGEPVAAAGTPDELLTAIGEALQSSGADGRSLRIAASLVQTLRRELALGPVATREELTRLRRLVGRPDSDVDGDGDLDALRVALCRRIASGLVKVGSAELDEYLWTTALARLQIDQPTYRSSR